MFSWIIRNHHDVQFEAHVALPDGVDVGDVRTLLRHRLHELQEEGEDELDFQGLNLTSE